MADHSTQHFYDRISHAYDLIADGGEHKAAGTRLEVAGSQARRSGARNRLWHRSLAGGDRPSRRSDGQGDGGRPLARHA